MTSPAARPVSRLRNKHYFPFQWPTSGFAAGVGASCTVTCDANSGMTNGDTVTISDGIRLVIYEYNSGAAASGHVKWTPGAGTAAQNAATLITIINATQPSLSTTGSSGAVVDLTNLLLGAVTNSTLNAKSSASSVLAITQFSGGLDPVATSITATTTFKMHKVKNRALRIARVSLDVPLGLAQSTSNYCAFQVLNGTNVAASWSTQTSANGTISADTPTDLVLSATASNLDIVDTGQLSLKLLITGTVTVPPGKIVIEFDEL